MFALFSISRVYFLLMLMLIVSSLSATEKPETAAMPIQAFLQESFEKVHKSYVSGEPVDSVVHAVLGNQSADMDSIVSAIVFAYANREQGFYIPVVNISKEDLWLRSDVLYMFDRLLIDPEALLYQSDLPFLLNLALQGKLLMTLVDHNCLAPNQMDFSNFVEAIVDHHVDEKIRYPLLALDNRMITPIGSNSTLIAKSILDSVEGDKLTPEAAYLLLAAILLDTKDLQNLSVTTEEDLRIAEILKGIVGEYYCEDIFEILLRERRSINHLTPAQLLKKDYKLYQEGEILYGIACITREVNWRPENRSEWLGALVESLERQQIDLLCALGYQSDANAHTFVVYLPSPELQTKLLTHFEHSDFCENFTLEAAFPEEGLFFYNLNSSHSRKKLQPTLYFKDLIAI